MASFLTESDGAAGITTCRKATVAGTLLEAGSSILEKGPHLVFRDLDGSLAQVPVKIESDQLILGELVAAHLPKGLERKSLLRQSPFQLVPVRKASLHVVHRLLQYGLDLVLVHLQQGVPGRRLQDELDVDQLVQDPLADAVPLRRPFRGQRDSFGHPSGPPAG